MSAITLANSLPPHIDVASPTQDDLAYDDGVPIETQRHQWQLDLLMDSLFPWLDQRVDGYMGSNMFIDFRKSVGNKDVKGPDVFIVLGVPKGERQSWVVWEERKGPDVVIEILSKQTAKTDKGKKKRIYQDELRVNEYFWFDPFNAKELAGFTLKQGIYEDKTLDAFGRLVSEVLGLCPVRWHGVYRGVEATWLRWETLAGVLLPTAQELAIQAEQQAILHRWRAEQAEQRVAMLAEQLRTLGIDPEGL
jgi:Uma2 family endonuclease